MNKIKNIIFIIFVILLLPMTVIAAPSISGISGTFTDGETITISGTGFGTKSTVMPIITTYDHSTTGLNWSTTGVDDGAWTVQSDAYISSSANRTSVAPYIVVCPTGEAAPYEILRWDGSGGEGSFFYVSFWYYITESDICVTTVSHNYKAWRWYTLANGNTDIHGQYYTGGSCVDCGANECGKVYRMSIDYGYGDAGDWTDGYSSVPSQQWNHFEFLLYHGSGDESTDGYIYSVLNGDLHVHWTGFGLGTPSSNIFQVGIPSGDNYAGGSIYVSEVYIDNTESHVFISDNDSITNWKGEASARHTEIQVPSSWSASSVEVTLNRGSFGSSDTVYVYVVDSDGAISSGEEITLGGGEPDPTPHLSSPANLTGTLQ